MTCTACDGRRYTPQVLAYTVDGRSIADVLALTVEDAPEVLTATDQQETLHALRDVGLGYLSLGQTLTTLSGGERQRLELALAIRAGSSTLLLDEPSAGLHPDDVSRTLHVLTQLRDKGTAYHIHHPFHVMMAEGGRPNPNKTVGDGSAGVAGERGRSMEHEPGGVARRDAPVPDDVARLLADSRIIRNRRKIMAAIINARATVALREGAGLERASGGSEERPTGAAADSNEQPTGLVELGLLEGDVQALIDSEAYRAFYMHRAGHWLGMDVHDVGDYKVGGEWRVLEPGMAMTVEPGIYIAVDNEKVAKKWRGIGVRIEDDVLVTKTGCEIITGGVPKTVAEIEALMAAAREQAA